MSKIIYVNEYPTWGYAYLTDEDARKKADRGCALRVAVPYREVTRRTLNKTQAVAWCKEEQILVTDRPYKRDPNERYIAQHPDGEIATGPTYVSAVIALRKKLGVNP